MNELLSYLVILAVGVVAAFFAHRLAASGKWAALSSLLPLVGYSLTRFFC